MLSNTHAEGHRVGLPLQIVETGPCHARSWRGGRGGVGEHERSWSGVEGL